MAFDIVINDSRENSKSLLLYLDDYDFIMEKIENSSNYSVLKSKLEDYYGESEAYLYELDSLKLEITKFNSTFGQELPNTVKTFTSQFLQLIEYAILNEKTIQFVGD